MLGRKKKTEMFTTNNLELCTTIHQTLRTAQIPYEVKIANTGTQNRRTGTFVDRVGERPELEIQYYIYAPWEYMERAKYMTDEYRRSLSR